MADTLAASDRFASLPATRTLGDVVVSGSLRTRAYSSRWFGNDPTGDYTYAGSLVRLGMSRSKHAYVRCRESMASRPIP